MCARSERNGIFSYWKRNVTSLSAVFGSTALRILQGGQAGGRSSVLLLALDVGHFTLCVGFCISNTVVGLLGRLILGRYIKSALFGNTYANIGAL